jgi:hypothetical protein
MGDDGFGLRKRRLHGLSAEIEASNDGGLIHGIRFE